MTSSPPDSEMPAGRDERRGYGAAGIAAAIVVVLVLVVWLGASGFIAAWLSRSGQSSIVSVNGDLEWDLDLAPWAARSTGHRSELMMLAPALWLMRHSQTMSQFYNWEYRAAGGTDIVIKG